MLKIRLSLLQKTIISIAVIFAPIAITFAVGYRGNAENYKKLIVNDLVAISEAYETQINQFLETNNQRAQDFSTDGIIVNEIENAALGKPYAIKTLNAHLQLNKTPLDKTLHGVHVISLSGKIIASTRSELIGSNVSDKLFFSKGKTGASITEASLGANGMRGLIFSTIIVSSKTSRIAGVLAIEKDLTELNNLLSGNFSEEHVALKAAKGRHKTLKIYLTDNNKTIFASSLNGVGQKADTEPVNACVNSQKETSGFYKDYRGVEVAGASDCLNALNWILLTEVDSSEVFSTISAILRGALIGFIATAILTLVIIAALLKKVISPIGKLANAARRVSEGEYDAPIGLTGNDEVGALASAFDAMTKGIKERDEGLRAEIDRSHTYLEVAGSIFLVLNSSGRVILINKKGCEILGYGYAEVIGKSWIDAFIPERDRAETQKSFNAVISGEIAPYEKYENRILTKNGYERIIAWQNAVLKDAAGAIYATVSSGEDITEKQRAEDAVRINAERISRQQKALIRLAGGAATTREEKPATTTPFLCLSPPPATIIEDLPSALRYITKTAGDTLESEHVCVWMFSESRKQLKCANHFEKSSNTHSEGYSFDIDKAAGYISVIESERAVAAEDAQNNPLTAELNEVFLKPRGIISLLSAPIRIAGKLRGVATFAHSAGKKTWFADEINFSAEVADQLAQAFIEDERAKKEAELKKLSMVIEHSVNVVFITDSAGVIEYTNPVFKAVTGYSAEEAIGKNASILASGEVSKDEYRDMWQLLKDGNTWRGIFKNKRKDGSFYWCNTVITPIRDDFGAVAKFLSVQEDITEKRVSEEKIHLLEAYDTVTGLFNRDHFMKEMNNCLPEAQKLGLHGALMVIDLDHFQYLNDTYGHAHGDQTLQRVAKIIDDAVNEISAQLSLKIKGFTGRLCSDEFAVFLPDVGTETALASADNIRSKIAAFSAARQSEHLTASIGAALMPEHGMATSELFTKADAAMFRAKELGRNRTKLFSAEDKDLENMHIRLDQKERILRALEEDRFTPWFQPILDIKKNTVSHYEALARMRSEDGEILPPGAFIDTAERFGLIGAIDRIIIDKTMVKQAALAGMGKPYTFSVNLSGKDLGDAEFLEFLKERAVKSGVQADYLIFEITETAAIRDFDKAVKFIRELKALGFRFSLDDFGVGFTSFRYLKDMGVNYIKIDGAFIKKLDDDETDMLFVKAIASVAAGMGIKTVAEFVEREAVLGILAEFGIDYAQGYFIGKPAPDVM